MTKTKERRMEKTANDGTGMNTNSVNCDNGLEKSHK